MIDFIKTWANQIIVAVIIATIFEMLLPNSNNKKYIKMIIGIYVLFTVIQPIASKLTGNKLEISSFNYEKYVDSDILKTSSKDFENNNSNLIEQAYINNIKVDIKTKLKQKGYEVISCKINIINTEYNYGEIENIILKIQKQVNEDKSKDIAIEKVEINISNEEVLDKSNISDNEQKDIIEYLAEEYSIDKTKIIID